MYTYIIRSVRHTIHTAISCVQCKHVIYNTFILSLIAHNESPWPEIQPLLHRMLSHFPPYKNSHVCTFCTSRNWTHTDLRNMHNIHLVESYDAVQSAADIGSCTESGRKSRTASILTSSNEGMCTHLQCPWHYSVSLCSACVCGCVWKTQSVW